MPQSGCHARGVLKLAAVSKLDNIGETEQCLYVRSKVLMKTKNKNLTETQPN